MDGVIVPSETKYARSGDVHIAQQVVGNGPLDLVFVMGWVSHVDSFWEEPRVARVLRRLASFSRLIPFDKRGAVLAEVVYRRIGVDVLRRAWVNVDLIWAGTFAVVGTVTLGAGLWSLFAA